MSCPLRSHCFGWDPVAAISSSSLQSCATSFIGYALWEAQNGGKHPDAKPLKGFGGGGVLELVEDQQGNTYRAVYTVKFAGAVYALHAFQKKSKRGSKTSQADIELIRSRLKLAELHYEQWRKSEEETNNRR